MPIFKSNAVSASFSIQNANPGALAVTGFAVRVTGPDNQPYPLAEGSGGVTIAAGATQNFSVRRGGGFPARGIYRAYAEIVLNVGGTAVRRDSAATPVNVPVWERVTSAVQATAARACNAQFDVAPDGTATEVSGTRSGCREAGAWEPGDGSLCTATFDVNPDGTNPREVAGTRACEGGTSGIVITFGGLT